jgi:predicted transposase YbfD/YdcC
MSNCSPTRETRYYLTSSAWRADRLGPMVRDHWAVENGLHWVMDMTFRDDECRIRTDLAPEKLRRPQTHGGQHRP